MPTPSNPEQRGALERGRELADRLYTPAARLDELEDEIEDAYRTAELAERWDLRGWLSNGFDARWDALAALDERSAR